MNQRRHRRLPVNLPIRVCATRGAHIDRETGRMVDVSEGGLCFVGARYLAPGTSVAVEFADCRISGEVKHCSLRTYASRVQFVTGVQVQQVDAGQESWKGLTVAS
jgi:hypothetical protein